MFVFFIANLPLPIIIYLNIVVTLKFLRVRHVVRHTHASIEKPERLIVGWWLGNISNIFALAPAITERRIFVQNKWWIISYMIAAAFSITGLILMNSGLGEELRDLARLSRRKKAAPAKRKRAKRA